MEQDIHRGIREIEKVILRKSLTVLLYDIKSNLNKHQTAPTLFPRHPCLPNVYHY
jgi:hypothetical protein